MASPAQTAGSTTTPTSSTEPHDEREAQSTPRDPSCMREVQREWLAAAKRSDLERMKQLRKQHPRWLDLERAVGDFNACDSDDGHATSSKPAPRSSFCSWEGFHLDTIGASVLHTAAWHDDTDIVQYLLESGQSPDTVDDAGMTPLMVKIMSHNLQALRCMFRNRVAIQRNLIMDCREEDAERIRKSVVMTKLFVRNHANLDACCQQGKTALHFATTNDTYEVAKVLLDGGANIDAQDETGKTPLHHAIETQSLLASNLLVAQGAQLNLADRNGVTPLSLVIKTEDVVSLQLMLNHHELVATADGQDFAGSVLMQAMEVQALPIVQFLLENDYCSVVSQNASGETPMHFAIKMKTPGITQILRDLDVDGLVLASCTTSGESCLHYAARYASPEELQLLLDFCTTSQCNKVQQPYLEREVLLNALNAAGSTPLFLAAAATSDSHAVRDTKTKMLADLGARLFCDEALLAPMCKAASSSSRIPLPSVVQMCLRDWLAECGAKSLKALTEFCLTYLAIISTPSQRQHQAGYQLLDILLCADHTIDTVPLLLSLAFDHTVVSKLLTHLEAFGASQRHGLIQCVHQDLVVAWSRLLQPQSDS